MELNLERIIAVCGHYGSGKTNLSVNLALELAKQGKHVTVSDLDIVNPYFRTADFGGLMAEHGIRLVCPQYANTNLDIPVLPPMLGAAIRTPDQTVLIDVGGDDDGAIALGGFARNMEQEGYSMLYVVNRCRYLEEEVEEEAMLLRAVEAASRLKVSYLVNTTNLGSETTLETILGSMDYLRKVSEAVEVPILCTAARRDLADGIPGPVLPIDVFVKAPWER